MMWVVHLIRNIQYWLLSRSQHPNSQSITHDFNTANLSGANYTPALNRGTQYSGESGVLTSPSIPSVPFTLQSFLNQHHRVEDGPVTANPGAPFQGVLPNPRLMTQLHQTYPLSVSPSQWRQPTRNSRILPCPNPLSPTNVGPSPAPKPCTFSFSRSRPSSGSQRTHPLSDIGVWNHLKTLAVLLCGQRNFCGLCSSTRRMRNLWPSPNGLAEPQATNRPWVFAPVPYYWGDDLSKYIALM